MVEVPPVAGVPPAVEVQQAVLLVPQAVILVAQPLAAVALSTSAEALLQAALEPPVSTEAVHPSRLLQPLPPLLHQLQLHLLLPQQLQQQLRLFVLRVPPTPTAPVVLRQ